MAGLTPKAPVAGVAAAGGTLAVAAGAAGADQAGEAGLYRREPGRLEAGPHGGGRARLREGDRHQGGVHHAAGRCLARAAEGRVGRRVSGRRHRAMVGPDGRMDIAALLDHEEVVARMVARDPAFDWNDFLPAASAPRATTASCRAFRIASRPASWSTRRTSSPGLGSPRRPGPSRNSRRRRLPSTRRLTATPSA